MQKSIFYMKLEQAYYAHTGYDMPAGVIPLNISVKGNLRTPKSELKKHFPSEFQKRTYTPWSKQVDLGPQNLETFLIWVRQNKRFKAFSKVKKRKPKLLAPNVAKLSKKRLELAS